jgi:hypothetical protein
MSWSEIRNPGPVRQLQVCLSFASTNQSGEEGTYLSKQTAFQHESVTSLQDQRPREVASLAMAYQTLRSTVVRSSPLVYRHHEDRDPLFLVSFLPKDEY